MRCCDGGSPNCARAPLPLAGRGRGWGSSNTLTAPACVPGTPPLTPPRQGEGEALRCAPRRHHRARRIARGGAALLRGRRRWPSSGSAWSRCRSAAPRRCPSPCSTATTGCCAPTPRPTAAGGCRSRSKDVDPRYLAMLLAFEDKRFRTPPRRRPVSPSARAGWQLVRHGRIVSGGSTLTMQVARLLHGEHERTGAGKLRQVAARAAARAQALQGRDPAALSAPRPVRRQPRGRARRLARLLRQGAAPPVAGRSGPARGAAAVARAAPSRPLPEAARRARNRVLAHAAAQGVDPADEARRAARPSACRPARREFPMLAPHLADAEVERSKTRLVHRLTHRRRVSGSLEQLTARARATRSAAALSAAADRARPHAPARSSPTSARPAISTRPASAPST